MREDSPRSSDLPPGYDKDDPYENENLSCYPQWWRENIEEFRAHDMRPYRPSQFIDGEYTFPLITELEDELDVVIQLRATNPQEGEDWELYVDNKYIAAIGHHREGDGYSLYEIESTNFESLIRDVVTE